ncbi:MAG: hypothetical protein HRT47_08475 [Candidatus Caenarcaniphilales bacterium]|nr:hypothetical protein [Candidatus Caenarcaniphilales bacterium]
MKKLVKIFTAFVVAIGFSSFLNACNVSKAPESESAVDVSIEEVNAEAVAEGAEEAHEAAEHKCGADHKCGEGKCGQE